MHKISTKKKWEKLEVSELVKRLASDDYEISEAQKLSQSMCKYAEELYLCETLDAEIESMPEMAKAIKVKNIAARRKAFIMALIKLTLDDLG